MDSDEAEALPVVNRRLHVADRSIAGVMIFLTLAATILALIQFYKASGRSFRPMLLAIVFFLDVVVAVGRSPFILFGPSYKPAAWSIRFLALFVVWSPVLLAILCVWGLSRFGTFAP